MSQREELRAVVERLPEEQIGDVLDYIEDLQVGISPDTLNAIREGLDDVRHGRVVTVDEYRRTRGL